MNELDSTREICIVKAKPLADIPIKTKFVLVLFSLIVWFFPATLLALSILNKEKETIVYFLFFLMITIIVKALSNSRKSKIVFDFKNKRVVFTYNFRERIIFSNEVKNWRLHCVLMRGRWSSYQRIFFCTLVNGETFQYNLLIKPVLDPQETQGVPALEKDYTLLFKKAFDMEPEKMTKSKSRIDEIKVLWDAIWF